MPIVTFRPAARKGAHVIITAYGESGCGKTFSLIQLGRGLVGPRGKLGMLDTETGRGMIYANMAGGYEYAELTPPFTPERYIEAIDAAEEAGIEALIIDSGSHEWEGLGGILEIADSQTSKQGEALQGLVKWAKPKARHKRYVQRLLNSRMHLLISLRAKEKLVQAKNPKTGKEEIISGGYVPIQDKRFMFETTVQLFLPTIGKRGLPVLEKCPQDLLGAFSEGALISEETGKKIADWVNGGVPLDHAFEKLKRRAEEVAGLGTESLRDFWRRLDKPSRERLTPHAENLGSIARAADQEAEDRGHDQSVDDDGSAADRQHDDPFGLPPLPTAPAEPDPGAGQDRPRANGDRAPPPGGATLPPDHPGDEGQQPPIEKGEHAREDNGVVADHQNSAPPRGVVIAEIVPAKGKGGFDWAGYAGRVLAEFRQTAPADRRDFRNANARFLGLFRSADRRAQTDLMTAMADVEREGAPA